MRAISHAMLAFAVSAFGLPAPPAAAQEQRVRLTPTAVDDALMEFTRLCLRPFPNAAKVRAAIAKSSYRYVRGADLGSPQWLSPKAVVGLTAPDGPAIRCAFDALLTERIEPGVLAGLVQNRLQRELGTRAPSRQDGAAIVWRWTVGTTVRELTFDFGGGNRQLSLSLADLPL